VTGGLKPPGYDTRAIGGDRVIIAPGSPNAVGTVRHKR
jgi:hypothetical protein